MDDALVQYHVAPAGVYSDGALALLVAQAALLGEARWGTHADYRRWRTIRMTKIVLEAAPDDFTRARRAPEVLAVDTAGHEAAADETAAAVVVGCVNLVRGRPGWAK